ncbi:MAG: GntR family transcriptional regulator [Pirellulales bacterium]|nr:GntR family transcriptional regulator [Pirellulales bacterium]
MSALSANSEASGATLARHRVRDAVQQLILSGEFQPGRRLVQQELAQRFGVAQSVVRESLLELQFCGLVEAVDNLGMFVSELDVRTLLAAYEIREMFEGLAARLCCERASRADLRELADLANRTYDLARQGKPEAMSESDRQFHFRMVQASQNPLLARLTEGYRLLGLFVRANRPPRQVRDDHFGIVAAIEANRPDEAERLARRHVEDARKAIERQVAEGTFVPQWVGTADEPPPKPKPKTPREQKTAKKGKAR